MRAAVMEGIRQPLVVHDVPDPTLSANGVVLRVEANGICRSDWHLWTGDWSWFGLQVAVPHVLAPRKLVHRTIPLEEAGEVLASMERFATVGVTVIDRYDS